uniref:Endoglucanase n=1 Tax=Pericapritermes sp. PpEG2 TaxID=1353805 RepID=A0A075BR40_9NEOP|nr:endo-beta-1,4-glucanase 2 [Pericapritermes sp. PpEG2]
MRVFFCLQSAHALCQAAYDYNQVLRESILFYEAQRSGRLPADLKVTWRKDSALNDRGQNGEDLTGGYYDAGDFVKFGFPMAYTTTVLAWGLVDYEGAFSSAGALDDGRKAVKWATDYFLKAHTAPNELYGQVGRGDVDHSYWGRPEDMTMERPAYKIDTSNPGSDLAGETAAALAAASIVFKHVDPNYSDNLLTHAKQLFDFANNYRGKYSDSITDARLFYASGDYRDELVWAAAWLYSATNDNNYLNIAESLYNEFGIQYWGGAFNWDNKASGVQVLLAKFSTKQEYKDTIRGYVDYLINNQQKTPMGLLYIDHWGPLRHAANAAFIMLQAAGLGLNPTQYCQFAKTQIDYILGDAGRSFVCGFGNNPPTHPHHRSSSCPPLDGTQDWRVLGLSCRFVCISVGALVGGPDENDNYVDDRSDYVDNEVATDYNAGFQSAVAALVALGY